MAIAAGVQERRNSGRFEFIQEVHYHTIGQNGRTIEGHGTSLDMSSRGILFTTSAVLETGQLVEVSVSWPAKLDGNCALKLVARGRVVRAMDGMAAATIDKYEFHTRRAKAATGAGS